jgi:hypothetical protein
MGVWTIKSNSIVSLLLRSIYSFTTPHPFPIIARSQTKALSYVTFGAVTVTNARDRKNGGSQKARSLGQILVLLVIVWEQ